MTLHATLRTPRGLILILSLAPTVGLGIGRFAYSLVLPDMRDALGWSYSAAGFMNTVNAAGYLAGALVALEAVETIRSVRRRCAGERWPACVSLTLCALSGNFVVFSFARLLAGRRGGGWPSSPAARWRRRSRNRSQRGRTFCSACSTPGPVSASLSSGLIAPFVLQAFGPGSWWIVWWAMTLLTLVMTLPLLLAPVDSQRADRRCGAGELRDPAGADLSRRLFSVRRRLHRLHDLHDRLCARRRRRRAAQSAFWCLIGVSAFVTPWLWRRVLALDRGGIATAIILGVNALGAALPLFGHSPALLAVSALVFGVAFFAVVGSTTAFVASISAMAWPKGLRR